MKVEQLNKGKNTNYNIIYNENIKILVQNILQTENEGQIGYIMSSEDNFSNNRHSNVKQDNRKVSVIDNNTYLRSDNHIPLKGIGPSEFRMVSTIANTDYTNIILTGAMGSGKTAIIKFIVDHIKNKLNCEKCIYKDLCKYKDSLIIQINFNEIGSYKFSGSVKEHKMKTNEIVDRFKIELYNKLRVIAIGIYSEKNIIEQFQDLILKSSLSTDWKSHFTYLEYELFNKNKWISSSELAEKSKLLFYWIEERYSTHLDLKINLISYLLKFVRDNFPDRLQGCILIIYDNIDRIKYEAQSEIIKQAFALSESAKIKTLISARLTTYGAINTEASLSYHILENGASIPLKILNNRLKDYNKNKNGIYFLDAKKTIKEEYLNIITKRIENISKILSDSNNRLSQVFSALAGASTRRGLFLAERLFLNNVISFQLDNKVINQDILIKSLLVGINDKKTLKKNDELVSNIFSSYSNYKSSLINIRILQILNIYKINNETLTLFQLYNELSFFYNWQIEEVIRNINELIFVKKRLAYIYGISKIKGKKHFDNISDKEINIALAGKEYLKSLTINLSYVQNCFLSLNWSNYFYEKNEEIFSLREFLEQNLLKFKNKIIGLPIDFFLQALEKKPSEEDFTIPNIVDERNIVERLKFVRAGLFHFLNEDVIQTIKYLENHRDDFSNYNQDTPIISGLFSEKCFYELGLSVYRFLTKEDFNPLVKEELLNWLNLLIITNIWVKILFDRDNNKINSLIDIYKKYLGITV